MSKLFRLVVAAWVLSTAVVAMPHPAEAQLIISEFRVRGTNGANDEFIELYNNSGADHTVSAPGSSGYAVVASDGLVRFIVPNGTVIPNRGHYLGCNSVGYSLANLPAGNGTTATCDATYTTNIPENAGIALFNTADPASFVLANRMDAVGFTAEANTLYKEGTGVRNLTAFSIAYSYVRRLPGGCIGTNPGTVDSNCTNVNAITLTPEAGASQPQDTNNNREDFIFVDANGTQASSEGSQQRLGAAGPENLSSPIARNASMAIGLVDSGACVNCPPNQVRDLTNDPAEINDTFGSLFIRRKITNNSGGNVTRLRFRVVDITTFPSAVFSLPPSPDNNCNSPNAECAADLRPLTSTAVVVSTSGGNVTVQGTTLEQVAGAESQPNGGGFNSTLSAGTVTLATPLANGASIDVQFRLGVQQEGSYRFAINVEVLP